MSDACGLNSPPKPCSSCPWRCSSEASDIPGFDLQLAEDLAATCPDHRGMGPDGGASFFACHQSKEGAELACAGWLAQVGHRHPGVRMAILSGRLDPKALVADPGWPELHDNYQQVLEKLRAACLDGEAAGSNHHDR
ncbi:DUF6283 family protein [Cupriavidus sp. WS]|uniref:DUF6283 family protein n=1 Tax=Cupriavidus sp. WS TaxID=1312922 RepID=UPI003510CC95